MVNQLAVMTTILVTIVSQVPHNYPELSDLIISNLQSLRQISLIVIIETETKVNSSNNIQKTS